MRFGLLLLLVPTSFAIAGDDDPLSAPGFVTVDRLDGTGHVGTEVSTNLQRDEWRFDAHAQVQVPGTRWSLYAQVPLRHDPHALNIGDTVLGDIELGGNYAKRVGPHWGYVVRLGLLVPTLPYDEPPLDPAYDDIYDGRSNVRVDSALVDRRIADYATGIAEGRGLRAAWSPMVRHGKLFARVDLGLDVVFDGEASLTLARVQPALGVQLGSFSLSAEAAAVFNTHGGVLQGSIAGRQRLGPLELYGAVGTALSSSQPGSGTTVTVGIDVPL